jgi:hypothetical protein
VAADARVIKEGLLAGEGVEVCTANADTVDADEGFAGSERGFGSVVAGGELAGILEGNLEHGNGREEGEEGTETFNLELWKAGKGRSETIGGIEWMTFVSPMSFPVFLSSRLSDSELF